MKPCGCNLVLAMGCLMVPVAASAPNAPGSSPEAKAIGGSTSLTMSQPDRAMPPLPKSSPRPISSKMRAGVTLEIEAHGIPAAATTAPTAEITAKNPKVVRLARVTAYWPGEVNGDYFTNCGLSSTGAHLHLGHCAVDPAIIPYGSVVSIAGLGRYIAVDTGSAVVSRQAARGAAKTPEQQMALVVDLFFDNAADGEKFASSGPQYAAITWDGSAVADLPVDPQALERRKRFEEETRAMAAWVLSPLPGQANSFAATYP